MPEKKLNERQAIEIVKQTRPKKSEQMGLQVETGDNSRFLAHSLEIYNLPQIDRTKPDEVGERTHEYFNICFKNDMKPSVAGYALALGISRVDLFKMENGQIKSCPAEVINMIKRAKSLINSQLEDYMQNGKINPVSGIFLLKNANLGYTDQTDIVVSQGSSEVDEKTLISDAELLPGD